jgi:hypothetical protein
MSKGYPIDPPLQTKLGPESSFIQRHNQGDNCGGGSSKTVQRLLTMNSVARHVVTN